MLYIETVETESTCSLGDLLSNIRNGQQCLFRIDNSVQITFISQSKLKGNDGHKSELPKEYGGFDGHRDVITGEN